MKPIEEIISKNIKKILRDYNLNQNELAKIAGVSESTVGKWVLEKSSPRMGAIQRISDYFGLPKSYILNEGKPTVAKETQYPYFSSPISAGFPIEIDGVTNDEVEKISIPDNMMGKYAGQRDIFFTKIYGDSMNNIMPDGTLIAVKPVELSELKNDDIVVYSYDGEYAVKHYFKNKDEIAFIPDSKDRRFREFTIDTNDCLDLKIKGKVVLYIVELD